MLVAFYFFLRDQKSSFIAPVNFQLTKMQQQLIIFAGIHTLHYRNTLLALLNMYIEFECCGTSECI